MKLKINKDTKVSVRFPDCKSLLGQTQAAAESIINEAWREALETIAIGINGNKCIEYNKEHCKLTLFLDDNNVVIDVFRFELYYGSVD